MASLADLLPLVVQARSLGVPEADIPSWIQRLHQHVYTQPVVAGTQETAREQQGMQDAAQAQTNRAQTGLSLLDDAYRRSQQMIDLQRDPDNIVSYFAALAGLPSPGGSPVQELLGRGFQLTPTLPQPYADPQYQQLQRSLYDFGRPRTAEENIAETARGQTSALNQFAADQFRRNPDAFRRWTEATRGMAGGGGVMLHEPVVGVGVRSGTPMFTAAENGPERMEITPMKGVSQQLDPDMQQQMVDMVMGYSGGTDLPGYARGTRKTPLTMFPRQFGPSTDTGGRPTADPVAINLGATPGGVQVVANPAGRPANTVNQGGRTTPITPAQTQAYQQQAYNNALDYGMSKVAIGADATPAQRAMLVPQARTILAANLGGQDFLTGGERGTEANAALRKDPNRIFRSWQGLDWAGALAQLNPGGQPPAPGPLAPRIGANIPGMVPNTGQVGGANTLDYLPLRGYAAGTSVDASFDALSRVLARNPFAPPELMQALRQRQAPQPGAITQRFLANVSPSTWSALQAAIRGRIGGTALEDWASEVPKFHIQGYQPQSVRYA